MFFPCLSVCLSACLLARLLENTHAHTPTQLYSPFENACMDEILRIDRCRDMDELINF